MRHHRSRGSRAGILAAMAVAAMGLVACTSPGEPGAGEGVAVSVDDTGLPPSPIAQADVLLIPAGRAGTLEAEYGAEASDEYTAPYVSFEIDEAGVAHLDGSLQTTDGAGLFVLDVEAGSYVVCLANFYPDHTLGPPYRVRGCGQAELDRDTSLRVSHGEGGVRVVARSPD